MKFKQTPHDIQHSPPVHFYLTNQAFAWTSSPNLNAGYLATLSSAC
jgi:hypothetical protein